MAHDWMLVEVEGKPIQSQTITVKHVQHDRVCIERKRRDNAWSFVLSGSLTLELDTTRL